MSDYTKKPESNHAPASLSSMKDSKDTKDSAGLTFAEASKARSDSAAADKNKRESGKNKEHHKR